MKVQEELIPVSTFHICWYEAWKDLCLPLKWPSLAQEENSWNTTKVYFEHETNIRKQIKVLLINAEADK